VVGREVDPDPFAYAKRGMLLTSRPRNYNLRSQSTLTLQLPVQANGVAQESTEDNIPQISTGTSTESQINTVETTNTMAGAYILECFKGDGTQDINAYLRRYEQYRKCTGIANEGSAIATLAWHLDGTARLWFESLASEPTTIDNFKTLLTNRFKQDKVVDLSVYNTRQFVGESVLDFLHRLENMCLKHTVSDEIQAQIALNGMNRAMGSAISTHAPKNLAEVKSLASRMGQIQSAAVPEVNAVAGQSTTIDELSAQLAKLTARLDERDRGQNREQSDKTCGRCGGRCYSSHSCRANGKTCFKCGKLNHFGSKCRSIKISSENANRQQSFNSK